MEPKIITIENSEYQLRRATVLGDSPNLKDCYVMFETINLQLLCNSRARFTIAELKQIIYEAEKTE